MANRYSRKFHNIMEELVIEEVQRQILGLPTRLAQYIQKVEVETYALNRLPPLYASCQEGWQLQYKRGKKEYGEQVKTVVRQAIAAVQRDLLRHSTPLITLADSVAIPEPVETSARAFEITQTLASRYVPTPVATVEAPTQLLDERTRRYTRMTAPDPVTRRDASIRDGWVG